MIKSRSAIGRSAKLKGSGRERWVAKCLTDWWRSKFRRTPQSGGSPLAADYKLAGDVCTKDLSFPFHVEVKNQENWFLSHLFTSDKCLPWKWWNQALTECLDDDEPLLLFKRNYCPMWAMMFYDYFMEKQTELPTNVILLEDPFENDVIVVEFSYILEETTPKSWRRNVSK